MVHWYDQTKLKRRTSPWQDGPCAGVGCRGATGWPRARPEPPHLLHRWRNSPCNTCCIAPPCRTTPNH
ncbi:hypothetical protein [Azospirillum endophyticum]